MEKVYTITELAREFNFEGAGATAFLKRNKVQPVRVMKIGKREITLYSEAARTLCAEERKRRNAARAERAQSKSVNVPQAVTPIVADSSLADLAAKMDRLQEALDAQMVRLREILEAVDKKEAFWRLRDYPPVERSPFGPIGPIYANDAPGVEAPSSQAQQPIDLDALLGEATAVPADD